MTTPATVEAFAALVLKERKERIAATLSQWQADEEHVEIVPGKKYVKVNVGFRANMSGKYMIDIATGEIFGIKGYGQVHKGHRYGTLETVDQWNWGGYSAVPKDL